MGETSGERFIRLLNEQNSEIAARIAQGERAKPEPDLVRLQREQERRDKWGTLRARERTGNRPVRVRSILPRVDPS